MTFDNQIVSIIVRTNQEKRLPLLQNALISIIKNDYRPIEIIIVAQSEQQNFIEKLENICQEFTIENIQLKLVINRTSHDERAKNLNLGINAASGRYISFLDDDDIMYGHHISSLIEVLISSDVGWVYTDHCTAICDFNEKGEVQIISKEYSSHKINHFSLEKLCENGFIPIHAYLIDRSRVRSEILKVDQSFQVLEDYVFMLQLANHHLPKYLSIITCEYRFYNDASNSSYAMNQRLGLNYSEKAKIWGEAHIRVEKLKKQLYPWYKARFLSSNMRSVILARFAFLYKLRPLYRNMKNLMLNLLK